MKMLNFEHTSLDLPSRAQHTLTNGLAFITELEATIKSLLSKSFTQFKINRLSSALNTMSDAQLDKIGIARKDIKQHAEQMIKYEYDGL